MHNLMRDFTDEISGYLNNKKIADELSALNLRSGKGALGENLLVCYEKLVAMQLVGQQELPLIEAWLKDLSRLGIV